MSVADAGVECPATPSSWRNHSSGKERIRLRSVSTKVFQPSAVVPAYWTCSSLTPRRLSSFGSSTLANVARYTSLRCVAGFSWRCPHFASPSSRSQRHLPRSTTGVRAAQNSGLNFIERMFYTGRAFPAAVERRRARRTTGFAHRPPRRAKPEHSYAPHRAGRTTRRAPCPVTAPEL